jgi:O-antigen ligase
MLQTLVELYRALTKRKDAPPKTARDLIRLGLALALRQISAAAVWLWLNVAARRQRLPIIPPYVNTRHPGRTFAKLLIPIVLAFACLVYGFMFGLTAPYLLIPFAAPIVVLVLLAIWALPDSRNAPVKSMEAFYAAVLVSLLAWPNYLALSLPGLPWITAIRLFSFPMAFLFLICLSSSSAFRKDLGGGVRAAPGLLFCFVGFVLIQFATLPLSNSLNASIGVVINAQINWTIPFVVSLWLARQPGKPQTYATLLVLLSMPMIIIALFENRIEHLLWVNNVPSFLKIDDATAAKYMRTITRGYDLYRVRSIYASPLSFAEALALLTPLCIHLAVQRSRLALRVLGASLIPFFFVCIRFTDARLGVLGMLISFLAYFLLWGLVEFRRKAGSLIASAIVYGYPAAFALVIAATLFFHRVRVLVLGGGEQAGSTDARHEQIALGIPKILSHPLGYGAGKAAETLGYAPFGMITIDSYYLSMALDYGIVGFIMYYGIFLTAIVAAVRAILKSPGAIDTKEKSLLLPLTVGLIVVVVIRSVLSQEDNQILVFALLGFQIGVLYQVKQTAKIAREAEGPSAQRVAASISKKRLSPISGEPAARPPAIGRRGETVR